MSLVLLKEISFSVEGLLPVITFDRKTFDQKDFFSDEAFDRTDIWSRNTYDQGWDDWLKTVANCQLKKIIFTNEQDKMFLTNFNKENKPKQKMPYLQNVIWKSSTTTLDEEWSFLVIIPIAKWAFGKGKLFH